MLWYFFVCIAPGFRRHYYSYIQKFAIILVGDLKIDFLVTRIAIMVICAGEVPPTLLRNPPEQLQIHFSDRYF